MKLLRSPLLPTWATQKDPSEAASTGWKSIQTSHLEFDLSKKRHPFCLFSLVNEGVELFTIICLPCGPRTMKNDMVLLSAHSVLMLSSEFSCH